MSLLALDRFKFGEWLKQDDSLQLRQGREKWLPKQKSSTESFSRQQQPINLSQQQWLAGIKPKKPVQQNKSTSAEIDLIYERLSELRCGCGDLSEQTHLMNQLREIQQREAEQLTSILNARRLVSSAEVKEKLASVDKFIERYESATRNNRASGEEDR